MSIHQRQPDGSWVPAQPIGWQEEHSFIARLLFWVRRVEHCGDHEGQKRCLPWKHDWDVGRVSVPVCDVSARGIIKRCTKCPKVVAK
jgi:hypothetical protein